MDFRIFLEWDEKCGILLSKTYPLIDGIQNALKEKDYGKSISRVGIVMTCMAKAFKQRKLFKKETKEFRYDILLDYYLIKNVEMEQKKAVIRQQIIEITEQTNIFQLLPGFRYKNENRTTAKVIWCRRILPAITN